MLTTDEKAFLRGYKEQIELAVKNRAGAIPVRDLARMAEIWRREKDRHFTPNLYCGGCKMDLLRKMEIMLNEI